MKKLLSFFLAAILVSMLMVPASAAESGITMKDVTTDTETVYVCVSLDAEVTAAAVGLTYSYDSKLMTVLPDECKWIEEGTLSDFSKTANQAVWAYDGTKALSGDLVVLAFQIRDLDSFRESTVSCNVTLKNGSATVGSYQASAKVIKACNHAFGSWSSKDALSHVHKCDKCGIEETQSHTWNQGTSSTDPQKPNITIVTYKCSVCGGEKVTETPSGDQEVQPTNPQPTQPSETTQPTNPQPTYPEENTQPTTKPTTSTKPTTAATEATKATESSDLVTMTQPQDYNENPQAEEAMKEETMPNAIKVDETEAPATQAPATTGAEVEKSGSNAVLWIIAAIIAAAGVAGAAWVFIRKKEDF